MGSGCFVSRPSKSFRTLLEAPWMWPGAPVASGEWGGGHLGAGGSLPTWTWAVHDLSCSGLLFKKQAGPDQDDPFHATRFSRTGAPFLRLPVTAARTCLEQGKEEKDNPRLQLINPCPSPKCVSHLLTGRKQQVLQLQRLAGKRS